LKGSLLIFSAAVEFILPEAKGSHTFCNSQKDKKQCLGFIAIFEGKSYILAPKFVILHHFINFIPFIVKITPLETCFKAFKITENQEIPGALPPRPPPGFCPGPIWGLSPGPIWGLRAAPRPPASKSVVPPNFKSCIRPANTLFSIRCSVLDICQSEGFDWLKFLLTGKVHNTFHYSD
jgi:hypothetical protein